MPAANLTKEDFEKKISKGVVLVDFWAIWCSPCRMVSPMIEELAEEYKGRVLVAKVNVDEEPDLVQKFNIMSIPTVMIFKDGKEVDQVTGFVGKEGYQAMLDKIIR